ncbi:MAG TPA: alkaline D-peptidase [Flavobacteriales bacterium]|nr:alkaline D-peptidase [Flavobacteriales bacterium]
MNNTEKIDRIANKQVDGRYIHGISLCIQNESRDLDHLISLGNLTDDHPYFIASTTKLFTTAIILQLRNENKLRLEDPIGLFLSADQLAGLHQLKGIDSISKITIKHLLAQTSGIGDYFSGKPKGGVSLEKELMEGKDRYWSFEEAMDRARTISPAFFPGTNGKALYSDTNFQLLGKIIENITGHSYAQAVDLRISKVLGLKTTYVYSDETDRTPLCLYYKRNPLSIYKAMSSVQVDGGIVSNATESMVFFRAFFNGQLFPKSYLEELYSWNKIFFPLQYGVGITRFKVPWFFSPFKSIPEIIGHSGLSGAFAYYCPAKGLYLTGTVNQIHSPSVSYQMLIRILNLF